MNSEDLPERITLRQGIQSLIDFGKVAVAGVVDAIDTRLANAINTKEDEL